MTIRLFRQEDWGAVSRIYREGLETRNATFETEIPDYETWIKKFHAGLLYAGVVDAHVVAWAGLQPVSARKVYEGVAEVTIYVDASSKGKGVGTALMNYLIEQSERAGIWSLYAAIFRENAASIRLHRSTGFREIGYREKIAQLDGVWRDTILFERRSKKIGA